VSRFVTPTRRARQTTHHQSIAAMPGSKRSIAAVTEPERTPSKRHTRSSGNTPLESLTFPGRSSRRANLVSPTKPPTKSLAKPRKADIENSSPSGQNQKDDIGGDDDELLLSPLKRSNIVTRSKAAASKVVVEILSPRRLSKWPKGDQDSPSLKSLHRPNALPPASPLYSPQKRKAGPSDSPAQQSPFTTPSKHSPSKMARMQQSSPSRLPRRLPEHLHTCLNAQKRAILRALQDPPDICGDDEMDGDMPTNDVAFRQLSDLLNGTVVRGEGNSCLIVGPQGSGKTRVSTLTVHLSRLLIYICFKLVERCLKSLPQQPIVIRLSGWAQNNDRLAMREVAWQLAQQTGVSFPTKDENNDENGNPFVDVDPTISVSSSSHLPQLISVIPTLSRPTVVILDGFDLFALHPRQSLLYCLLDTAQSCQGGYAKKGIAVVGVTSRVDTINLLEKRVKSRFSGRILRTAAPQHLTDWKAIARETLCIPIEDTSEEWHDAWHEAVDDFLADPKVENSLKDTLVLTGAVGMLARILVCYMLVFSGLLVLTPAFRYPLY
jgi:origin recognition complex subunit 4